MDNQENPRVCRCLLVDIPEEKDLARIVAERIAAMPEDIRADEDERQARLVICRDCSALQNGTCGLCGCYVELRAAKRNQHCPAVPGKW